MIDWENLIEFRITKGSCKKTPLHFSQGKKSDATDENICLLDVAWLHICGNKKFDNLNLNQIENYFQTAVDNYMTTFWRKKHKKKNIQCAWVDSTWE